MPKKHSPRELSIHHSLVTGGRKLYEAVRSLPDCQACRIGAITGKSSSKRGVSVKNNGLGVLVEFHADDGIQLFTVSPVKGTSLAGLADAVVEMLSRRGYVILNGGKYMEQQKLPEPKPIAEDRADLAKAYQAILGTVEVGEDGKWRSKSAYNAIGSCFPRKEANRIFTQMCSWKILLKDEESTKLLETTRSSVYFVQKTEVCVPDFEVNWPKTPEPSGEEEVTSLLASDPGLVREGLECLWLARCETATAYKGNIETLDKKIESLRIETEGLLGERLSLEDKMRGADLEAKKIEEIVRRLRN